MCVKMAIKSKRDRKMDTLRAPKKQESTIYMKDETEGHVSALYEWF